MYEREKVHLSLKHVTQVTTTVAARDLHPPHAIAVVYMAVNRSGQVVVVCRPSASRVKFVLRPAAESGKLQWLQNTVPKHG